MVKTKKHTSDKTKHHIGRKGSRGRKSSRGRKRSRSRAAGVHWVKVRECKNRNYELTRSNAWSPKYTISNTELKKLEDKLNMSNVIELQPKVYGPNMYITDIIYKRTPKSHWSSSKHRFNLEIRYYYSCEKDDYLYNKSIKAETKYMQFAASSDYVKQVFEYGALKSGPRLYTNTGRLQSLSSAEPRNLPLFPTLSSNSKTKKTARQEQQEKTTNRHKTQRREALEVLNLAKARTSQRGQIEEPQ